VLGLALRRFNVICHAYCLMTNHFHLLLETPDANLSSAVRQFNSVSTQAFNRRHGQVGHLLQGRFQSIVLNPVRAGMVKEPGSYPWSSYRDTAGLDQKPDFLATDWIVVQFGENRPQALKAYQGFVKAGLELESPWNNLKGQCLLGDDAFPGQLYSLLKDQSVLKKIPRVQRFADRPALAEFLTGTGSRRERDAAIFRACHAFGYPQAEVATATGLHYSTVSKIIRKME